MSVIASSAFVHVGHLSPDPAWRMPPHHHPFHEIIAPLRGVLWVRVGDHVHTLGPGKLALYPAGVVHEEWTDPRHPIESFYLGFHYRDFDTSTFVAAEDPDGRNRQLLHWMHHDENTVRPGREGFVKNALNILVDWFANSAAPPSNLWVEHIRKFIHQNVDKPIDLDQLSKVAGCSRFHFVRKYKQLAGITPMADLRRIRTDHARERILTSNMSLKEVAQAAGFADEYTLSRAFRQLYGMPPGSFRRIARGFAKPECPRT